MLYAIWLVTYCDSTPMNYGHWIQYVAFGLAHFFSMRKQEWMNDGLKDIRIYWGLFSIHYYICKTSEYTEACSLYIIIFESDQTHIGKFYLCTWENDSVMSTGLRPLMLIVRLVTNCQNLQKQAPRWNPLLNDQETHCSTPRYVCCLKSFTKTKTSNLFKREFPCKL